MKLILFITTLIAVTTASPIAQDGVKDEAMDMVKRTCEPNSNGIGIQCGSSAGGKVVRLGNHH